MGSLKEIRNRIVSVNSTMQITSAMKMVSAAKLRRAQDAIVQMRPYAEKLSGILENLSTNPDCNADSPFTEKRDRRNVLVVVVTSNRGLCGPFNTNVIKRVKQNIQEKYSEQHKAGKLQLFCFGKKGSDFFKKNGFSIYDTGNQGYDNLNFEIVAPLAEKIMQDFSKGTFDRVEIVYNQFKNAGVQILMTENFLPIEPAEVKEEKDSGESRLDYIFEPSIEFIVEELIPKSLKVQLFKVLLDSHAAEHGARMTAMHKATDNAKDILRDLKLTYNKARQAAITNEILEIVGGAEALSG